MQRKPAVSHFARDTRWGQPPRAVGRAKLDDFLSSSQEGEHYRNAKRWEERKVSRTNIAHHSSGQSKQWARADEMEAQRVRAPKPTKTPSYRRPCDRNRVTGSATGVRRKIQRATAKPMAA
jgi:hypothetical protein